MYFWENFSVMKKWIIPVLLAAAAVGCGNRTEKKTAATEETLPDSLRIYTIVDSFEMNPHLGELVENRYTGVIPAADGPGIRYDLTMWSQAFKGSEAFEADEAAASGDGIFSGDGVYALVMTYIEGENGRDAKFYYSGHWGTLRGNEEDADATIFQLYGNEHSQDTYLLREGPDSLTILTADQRRINSPLNHTLTRVK